MLVLQSSYIMDHTGLVDGMWTDEVSGLSTNEDCKFDVYLHAYSAGAD
jgi:hypothetical protein